jgi:hypothetical protein
MTDIQAIAQRELNQYIEQQAAKVAPEQITTIELSFYDHEVYAGDRLIATINHDDSDFQTQPWLVTINNQEIFRDNTWAKCYHYITWHYHQGTLPMQIAQDSNTDEVITEVATQERITNNVTRNVSTREERAKSIRVLEQREDKYLVRNCENNHYYIVCLNAPHPRRRCDCRDCHYKGVKCKHQIAVENFMRSTLQELLDDTRRLIVV